MKLTTQAALADGKISVSIEEHPVGFVFVASVADAERMGIELLAGVARARREASERRTPRPMCRGCEHDCAECICASAEVIK